MPTCLSVRHSYIICCLLDCDHLSFALCPISLPTIALVVEQVVPGTSTCYRSTSRTCSSLLCPSVPTTEDLTPRGVWASPRSRDRSRSRGRGDHRTLREEPEPGSLACDRVPNNEPEEEPAPRFEHSPLGVNPQQQAQGAVGLQRLPLDPDLFPFGLILTENFCLVFGPFS